MNRRIKIFLKKSSTRKNSRQTKIFDDILKAQLSHVFNQEELYSAEDQRYWGNKCICTLVV